MRRLLVAVPVLVLVAACAGGSSTPSARSTPTTSSEVATYRAALVPSLDALYDGVQPFIDALAILERPAPGQVRTVAPLVDVARSGRVLQTVQKQARTIARLTAPPELADGAKRLDAALEQLAASLPPLLAAPGTKGLADVLNSKQTAFETALLDLDVAGDMLFPADAQPVLPSSIGGVLGGARPPVSKAAVLYAAAEACAVYKDGLKKLQATTGADTPARARRQAALVATAYASLLELPVPAADKATFDADVTSPLAPVVTQLPAAVDALLRGDAGADRELRRLLATVGKVSAALTDYGSTCGEELAFL